jgi:transposase-like protein
MEFLEGNSDVLGRLVTEMYARGLSTRDVEDALRGATGELLISKSAVSEITDRLWQDYLEFCERDLSGIECEYLFLDAVFESLRRYGAKEAVLAAWCITSDGRKVLLHLAVGNKESEDCWTEFMRHMTRRGLRTPTTVTSDGAPGLVNAIGQAFGSSIRIRCWYHKMANIRAKLPADQADEVLAHVRAVRDAPTLEAGEAMAASAIERFADRFPAAMGCLAEDLDASLAHLRVPARHRINVRNDQSARADLRGGAPSDQGDPSPPRREECDEARVRHVDPRLRSLAACVGLRPRTPAASAAPSRARHRS